MSLSLDADLASDPDDLHNLASDALWAEKKAEMIAELYQIATIRKLLINRHMQTGRKW